MNMVVERLVDVLAGFRCRLVQLGSPGLCGSVQGDFVRSSCTAPCWWPPAPQAGLFPACAVPVKGVVGITDGDTLPAIVDGRQIKVRLNGIDAPEKKQAFGNASKRALSDLAFGTRVSIVPLGKDRWGRTIAEMFTVDRQRVGLELVRQGMARHFVKYAPADLELAEAEKAARAGKRGLWSDGAPVAPWDWRKR